MPADLSFSHDPSAAGRCDTILFVGRARHLLRDDVLATLPKDLPAELFRSLVKQCSPGDGGRHTSTWLADPLRKAVIAVLPEICSRHNSPMRAWAIPGLVKSGLRKGSLGIVAAMETEEHAPAWAHAISRALPRFSRKEGSGSWPATVHLSSPGSSKRYELDALSILAEATRSAAQMVDLPPDEWNVDAWVQRAEAFAAEHDEVSLFVMRGEELAANGLGGLYGVGRAAAEPPALIVLDLNLDKGAPMAWVGKGIVYDTGGLSLKTKTGMPGMKSDMGGAAAAFAAFEAAVKLGFSGPLTAVLCVAENAIGPRAIRPDDILSMLSGKHVEVNNTDAEGRLVLADGVAWVVANRSPQVLVDLATLTGAQLVATGRNHAAIYTNDAETESLACDVGRLRGELVHPLPYAPELFRKEFTSRVADLRNSVKDRANAQSSCAGQFIGEHLGDFSRPWLHIDMAGPAFSAQRGTGWGPGLLLGLLGLPERTIEDPAQS